LHEQFIGWLLQMDVEKLLMMTTTNVRANWLQELFKII